MSDLTFNVHEHMLDLLDSEFVEVEEHEDLVPFYFQSDETIMQNRPFANADNPLLRRMEYFDPIHLEPPPFRGIDEAFEQIEVPPLELDTDSEMESLPELTPTTEYPDTDEQWDVHISLFLDFAITRGWEIHESFYEAFEERHQPNLEDFYDFVEDNVGWDEFVLSDIFVLPPDRFTEPMDDEIMSVCSDIVEDDWSLIHDIETNPGPSELSYIFENLESWKEEHDWRFLRRCRMQREFDIFLVDIMRDVTFQIKVFGICRKVLRDTFSINLNIVEFNDMLPRGYNDFFLRLSFIIYDKLATLGRNVVRIVERAKTFLTPPRSPKSPYSASLVDNGIPFTGLLYNYLVNDDFVNNTLTAIPLNLFVMSQSTFGKSFRVNGPTLISNVFAEEIFRTPNILATELPVKLTAIFAGNMLPIVPIAMHIIYDHVVIDVRIRILFHLFWNYMVFVLYNGYNQHLGAWLVMLYLMYDIETNPGPCGRKLFKHGKKDLLFFQRLMKNPQNAVYRIRKHFRNAEGYRLSFRDNLLSFFIDQTKPQADWDMLGLSKLTTALDNHSNTMATLAANVVIPQVEKCRKTFEEVAKEGFSTAREGIVVNHKVGNFLESFNDPKIRLALLLCSYCVINAVEMKYGGSASLSLLKFLIVSAGAVTIMSLPIISNLFSSWFATSPQSDENSFGWVSLLLEGVQIVTMGFKLTTCSAVDLSKTMDMIVKESKNLGFIVDKVVDWFKRAVIYVAEKFHLDVSHWFTTNDTRVKDLQKEVIKLQEEQLMNPMGMSLQFNERVTRLSMKVNDMISKTPNTPENNSINAVLNRLSRDLFSLSRMAAECGLEAGERNDPASILRVGAPGCGKSHDIDTAAMELAIEFASSDQLADIARNWKSQVYIWPLDGKHHDQYQGQQICMFPDVFSATDAEGQPSEALYLIYLISGTPLNLLAAELSKKQRLWFISNMVLLASNKLYLPRHMFKSIHNPDALIRRLMECCYYQWCKPEYAMRDAAGNFIIEAGTNRVLGYEKDDYLYAKIDPEKVRGVPDDDVWLFRRHDLSTGGFADNKILTRREYMDEVKAYVRRKMANGEAKRRLLKERSVELISRRLDPRPQSNIKQPLIDETFAKRLTKPQSFESEVLPGTVSEDIWNQVKKLYDDIVLRGMSIQDFISRKIYYEPEYVYREVLFLESLEKDRDLFYYFSNVSIIHIRKMMYENYEECNNLWRRTKKMCITNTYTIFNSCLERVNDFLKIPDCDESAVSNTNHVFWQFVKDPSFMRCLGMVGGSIALFGVAIAGFKIAMRFLEPKANAQPQVDSMIPGESFILKHQRNILACFIKHKTGNRHPCNVFMIGGRFGVTVRHLHTGMLARMEHKPDDTYHMVLVPSRGGTLEDSTFKYDYRKIKWFDDDNDLRVRDLIVFELPDDAKYPCMEKFIPPLKSLEYILQKGNLSATFAKVGIDKVKESVSSMRFEPMYLTLNNRLCVYNTSTMLDENETITGRVALKSWNGKSKYGTFRTEVGDCASICVITDERKNYCVNLDFPQAASEWIAYLHVAITDDSPQGVPIYRELFQRYFDMIKLPQTNDFMERLEEACQDVTEALQVNAINQECQINLQTDSKKLDKFHVSQFSSDETLENNSKSIIKRSPLYGIDPVTRKPARLHNFVNEEGEYVDVMTKAREPYGSNDTVYDPILIRRIIQDAMTHVHNQSSIPRKTEILSLDQAIKGDPAYLLGGLNANSSTGFIFRVLKKRLNLKGKGKRWMYEGETLKPEFYAIIKHIVEKNIQRLQRGERIFNVYIDNLKDELLSIEKVKAGKTRLFCSADMIYLLISRMYFGAFAGWVFENRIDNGIAIGINPYSREWDKSANHLLRNSLKFIFGDYGKFDKKQKRILMEACLVLMDMFYGDTGKLERHLLFEEIVDSLHVVFEDGKLRFYTWDHGNTSGNFLTAILNSLVNISIIFIVAIIAQLIYNGQKITSEVQYDFEIVAQNIAYLVLGDDMVLSVTDRLPYLTFRSFKMICEKFLGLEFTDELKTSGIVPDYREIQDGSFLGRKFILSEWLGSPKWWAPLRLYSVIECVQWIKGVYDPDIEVAKIESMNLELSEGSREVFESYVPRYAAACLKAYGRLPKYTDYDTARATIVGMSTHQYSFDTFLVADQDSPCIDRLMEFYDI